MTRGADFPPFQPHPLVRGGHAQTLAAVYWPAERYDYRAVQHLVDLVDGDQIVLHDDCPAGSSVGSRTVLLMHGLGGSHASGYMQRIAAKLNARGVRTFRMDFRGCGAGFSLAKQPFHGGRSPDAAAAIEFIARLCPGSPTTIVGFSLGGNIALKLLGELADAACGQLDSGVAICPSLDLRACCDRIRQPSNRLYDRHFVSLLLAHYAARRQAGIDTSGITLARRPRSVWDFDEAYTAPASGFGSVENYYRTASAAGLISRIRRPVLVLQSRDDPLVPYGTAAELTVGPTVEVRLTAHGGHMGFIGRSGIDPDRRWMDWRVVDWITAGK